MNKAYFNKKWTISGKRQPRKCVMKFIDKYFKEDDYVLDYGCGEDRHLEYMAKKGLRVMGLDTSEVAIKKSNDRFDNKEIALSAGMNCFTSNAYDGIICNRVIEYNDTAGVQDVFIEMSRILKSGAYVFIATRSVKQKSKSHERHIRTNEDGGEDYSVEGDTIHHYFSEQEIIKLCFANNFKLCSLYERKVDESGENKYEWQFVMRRL